jgi:hypothetical protein
VPSAGLMGRGVETEYESGAGSCAQAATPNISNINALNPTPV